jgi:hypothetical protein
MLRESVEICEDYELLLRVTRLSLRSAETLGDFPPEIQQPDA